jgi:FkbM family methyltransferase
LREEFPEQKMAVKYLKGDEKVLEIGGNIGRNSCVIGRILNHSDFVTLECDSTIAKQLIENRDLNGLTFHVEIAALSKRPLIQKEWDGKIHYMSSSNSWWASQHVIEPTGFLYLSKMKNPDGSNYLSMDFKI